MSDYKDRRNSWAAKCTTSPRDKFDLAKLSWDAGRLDLIKSVDQILVEAINCSIRYAKQSTNGKTRSEGDDYWFIMNALSNAVTIWEAVKEDKSEVMKKKASATEVKALRKANPDLGMHEAKNIIERQKNDSYKDRCYERAEVHAGGYNVVGPVIAFIAGSDWSRSELISQVEDIFVKAIKDCFDTESKMIPQFSEDTLSHALTKWEAIKKDK